MGLVNMDVNNKPQDNAKVQTLEVTASGQVEMKMKGTSTHDPGWNDPPMLSYGVGLQGPAKFIKKGLLNKRVPFPLGSLPPSTQSTSTLSATPPKKDPLAAILPLHCPQDPSSVPTSYTTPPVASEDCPPKCSPSAPVQVVMEPVMTVAGEDRIVSSEISLDHLMKSFEEIINELSSENLNGSDVDIRKRLEIMKKMWNDGKLNGDVQLKMMQLVEALKTEQYSRANDIHIELIVDHTSLVGTWMPGIRKLIRMMMSVEKIHGEEFSDAIEHPSDNVEDEVDECFVDSHSPCLVNDADK